MSIERELAARLPGLHESQERTETRNLLDAGLGEALGVQTRAWEGGLWSVRCRTAPDHEPGNQIMGLTEGTLERLPELVAWFDEAGCSPGFRWPGTAIGPELGARLHGLGLHVNELEAWMAAPLDTLDLVEGGGHDVIEVRSEAELDAWVQAFFGGWQLEDPDKQRVARAAMAPWPGPASWRRYVARIDGEPAGEALLVLFDDVAYLAEAATVPRFRRRGIQRALIARRLADARAAGASTVFGGVVYGDRSWANMRANGLREAFLTVSFRRRSRRR